MLLTNGCWVEEQGSGSWREGQEGAGQVLRVLVQQGMDRECGWIQGRSWCREYIGSGLGSSLRDSWVMVYLGSGSDTEHGRRVLLLIC